MLFFPPVIPSIPIGLGTCLELISNWLVTTSSTNDRCPPQLLLGKKPNGQIGKGEERQEDMQGRCGFLRNRKGLKQRNNFPDDSSMLYE